MTAAKVGLQESACRRAERALGLKSGATLKSLELSVALKYALSQRSLDDANDALDSLCALWDWSKFDADNCVRQALERDPIYRHRLIESARDALLALEQTLIGCSDCANFGEPKHPKNPPPTNPPQSNH